MKTVHENEIKETNKIHNKDKKRKKVRRSKKIKNKLKQFKTIYQNIRGMKCKVDSFTELVEDQKPTIVCLVETHLKKEEEVAIPGYETINRNDKTANSGGILEESKINKNCDYANTQTRASRRRTVDINRQ